MDRFMLKKKKKKIKIKKKKKKKKKPIQSTCFWATIALIHFCVDVKHVGQMRLFKIPRG